jgi:hypothetical protein
MLPQQLADFPNLRRWRRSPIRRIPLVAHFSVSLSYNVSCFHATALGLFSYIRQVRQLLRGAAVQLLAKAVDWYFMIAAPTVLAVIALRATGLSRR